MGRYLDLARQLAASFEACPGTTETTEAVKRPESEYDINDIDDRSCPSFWLTEFEERAAILEYEQGLSLPDAEARAHEIIVARWLNENPPETADPNKCAVCGCWLIADFVPIALRAKDGSPIWLHLGGVHSDGCLRAFWKMRRAEAEQALDVAGVPKANG